jgi:hypothetical protein
LLLFLILAAGAAGGILFQRSVGVGNLLRGAGYAYPTRTPVPPTPPPAAVLSADNIPEAHRGNLALFILAGQSNMSGVGEVPADAPGTHPQVFLFGNDYHWRLAEEPLDDPTGQVDQVSLDRWAGYGPGLAFAIELLEQDPSLQIGLIPCPKWSSSISEWQRNLSDFSLYGSCIKRARAASPMGKFAGLLFFQGEAEVADPQRFPQKNPEPDRWAEKFTRLVTDMREDLGDQSLPVVFAQIGPYDASQNMPEWETVQAQQASIQLPGVAMIETADLNLQDDVHFTAESYEIIGARFAEAYRKLVEAAVQE